MPKIKANRFISNLSLTLPRRIHRLAKAKALRAGAPSFSAYVAMVLEAAPDEVTAAQLIRTHSIELLVKASTTGDGDVSERSVSSCV